MATLTLTSIRAFNIHPGTTAHITGKSHTYVTFSVNGVQETTSVFDSEASQHAVWKDTITMNLNSGASGELKVCRASSMSLDLLCIVCFCANSAFTNLTAFEVLMGFGACLSVLCSAAVLC